MNLIFHIIRKDFRRVWPLLAAWWAVLVLQALVPLWFFSSALNAPIRFKYEVPAQTVPVPTRLVLLVDRSLPNTLAETNSYFIFAGVVLVAVMAAMLIQEDSPGIERAHWQLLPVSRGKMVAAKLLFFAVIIGLTAPLPGVAAKILYGLPADEWFTGSESAGLFALFWVTMAAVPMLLLQSATARVLSVLGLLGFFGVLVYWDPYPNYGSQYFDELVRARILWATWELPLYTIILALLRYQRVSRTNCFSFTVFCIGLIMLQFLVYGQPANSRPRHPTYAELQESLTPRQEKIPPQTIAQTETVLTQAEDQEHNWTGYTLYGKLANALPITVKPGQVLLYQKFAGPTLQSDPRFVQRGPVNPDRFLHFSSLGFHATEIEHANNLSRLAAAAGLGKLLDEHYDGAQSDVFPILDYKDVAEAPWLTPPTSMTGALQVEVGDFHRWPDLPLTPGASVKEGTTQFEYLGTQHGPGGEPVLTFAIQSVDLTYDVAPKPASAIQQFFLLWNQARGECALCNPLPGSGSVQMTAHDMSFNMSQYGIVVNFSQLVDGTVKTLTPAETQTWLAGAKLVRLTYTPQLNYAVPVVIGPISLPVTADTK